MTMHKPPHPGEFIKITYMDPFKISIRTLSKKLEVASSTLSRIINESSSISPEMAHRLSKVLGRTPESWLYMQAQYDLWQVKNNTKLSKLKKIDFTDYSN